MFNQPTLLFGGFPTAPTEPVKRRESAKGAAQSVPTRGFGIWKSKKPLF